MKIIYIYKEEWEKDYVKKVFSKDLVLGKNIEEIPEEEMKSAEIISVFVNTELNRERLSKMPNVKLIATRSTGYDHIDSEYVKEKNIMVSNVPIYGENTVAEFTFSLLLTISRKTYDAYKRVSETGSFSQKGLRGFDLEGKTLGVIGTGKIGSHVIRIAKGFEMKVLAYDIYPSQKKEEMLNFKYTDIDTLLQESDVITIHTPHNEKTHHLINDNNISKIKRGAYLINTARGGLVKTSALVKALQKDILAGAGLDVLEEEGLLRDELELLSDPHPKTETLQTTLSNHYLIDHPRVIITPHNAFNTEEAIRRIIDTSINNIKAFEQGNPINIVKNA